MKILPGLLNPVHDAQAIFTSVLKAFSYPGTFQSYSRQSLNWPALTPSTTAILLALCDHDTSLYLSDDLNTENIKKSLSFHTQAPIVQTYQSAQIAVFNETLLLDKLATLNVGTEMSPETSTTVIVQLNVPKIGLITQKNQVQVLSTTENCTDFNSHQMSDLCLTGPGILDAICLRLMLSSELLDYLTKQSRRFPCGVDFIFTTPTGFLGIPRTTQIEVLECTYQ